MDKNEDEDEEMGDQQYDENGNPITPSTDTKSNQDEKQQPNTSSSSTRSAAARHPHAEPIEQ